MPIIRIGIGTHIVQRVRDTLSEILKVFKARVESEGGTIESTACIDADIKSLQITVDSLQYMIDAHTARVLADGGVIESATCLTNVYTDLEPGKR